MHPLEDPQAAPFSPLPEAEHSYFNGRVALVTGGGSGVGAIVAEMIAHCGGRVIVTDIDGDRAKAVASAIDGIPIALDVADPPSWDSLSLETPPTIAFLNAGIASRATIPYEIHEVTRAEVTRTVGANFLGVLHGLRRLTPAMSAVGDARICLNASWAALSPQEYDPLYTATKYAVLGLGRSVAGPLAAKGVRITMLCPTASDNPDVSESIRDTVRRDLGQLLEPRTVAQAALDLIEFGQPGEIRSISPNRYSRVKQTLEFEAIDPDEAFGV